MSFEEKNTWVYALVSVAAFAAYLVTILGRAQGIPVSDVPYIGAMLWSIGAAIAASIVGRVVIAVAWPRDADRTDQGDKEIYRFGEYVGQWLVVIGAAVALLLAMAEVDHFWIANELYLAFVLAALLSSAAKLVAYRRGFQLW
jgi:hypothetical protein